MSFGEIGDRGVANGTGAQRSISAGLSPTRTLAFEKRHRHRLDANALENRKRHRPRQNAVDHSIQLREPNVASSARRRMKRHVRNRIEQFQQVVVADVAPDSPAANQFPRVIVTQSINQRPVADPQEAAQAFEAVAKFTNKNILVLLARDDAKIYLSSAALTRV